MDDQLIITLKVEDLRSLISESVSNVISKIPIIPEEEILLRKKEVAKLLSVSLVTITDWMKTGKLPYHRINSRVFFKKSEIMEAMKLKAKSKKYKRNLDKNGK